MTASRQSCFWAASQRVLRLALGCIAAAAIIFGAAGQADVEPVAGFKPNPATQQKLDAMLRSQTRAEWRRRMADLETGIEDERAARRLYQEIVHFLTGVRDNPSAAALFIPMSRLGLSPGDQVDILVPYLGSEDAAARNIAVTILEGLENRHEQERPNYGIYRSYVEKDKSNTAFPLIRRMYADAPREATMTLNDANFILGQEQRPSRRDLLWAVNAIDRAVWIHKYNFVDRDKGQSETLATEQMRLLSGGEGWWVRLYVAEIMHQHSFLRQPEIIQKLKDDPHSLVKESIAAILAEKAPATTQPAEPKN